MDGILSRVSSLELRAHKAEAAEASANKAREEAEVLAKQERAAKVQRENELAESLRSHRSTQALLESMKAERAQLKRDLADKDALNATLKKQVADLTGQLQEAQMAFSGKTLLLGKALREATAHYLKAAASKAVGGGDDQAQLVRELKDKARLADGEIKAAKATLNSAYPQPNGGGGRGDDMDVDGDDKENGEGAAPGGGKGAGGVPAASEAAAMEAEEDALAASESERATLRDLALQLHMENAGLRLRTVALDTITKVCAKKCGGKCAQLLHDVKMTDALHAAEAGYEQALLNARGEKEADGEGMAALLTSQGLEALFGDTDSAFKGCRHQLAHTCVEACEAALSFTPLPVVASEGDSAAGHGKAAGSGGAKPSLQSVMRNIVLSPKDAASEVNVTSSSPRQPPSSVVMVEDEGAAGADAEEVTAAAAAGSSSAGGAQAAVTQPVGSLAAGAAGQEADTMLAPLSPASDNSATGAAGKAESPLPAMSQE